MIHFSCDRCKRSIDTDSELRYVVRLEVEATLDASTAEMDNDRDHLMEVSEMLERLEAFEDDNVGDDVYQKSQFDLCPQCYRKFIQNPLGRETVTTQLNFSKN
jgi:hypothetical protein